MAITTLLIDDEPLALAELEKMLGPYADIEVIARARDAREAGEIILKVQPELIFLDISMPGKSGFELLEELDHLPQVVFVTAYDQYAIKAFDINALDYILKPVNAKRLEEAILKVRKNFHRMDTGVNRLSPDKKIFIRDGDRCYFVPLQEIFFIESAGNYAKVYYQDQVPLLHRSLNYLDEKLPPEVFFRGNRQVIFNINFIKKIIPYFNNCLRVELQSGQIIEISQRQSVRFKEMMGI